MRKFGIGRAVCRYRDLDYMSNMSVRYRIGHLAPLFGNLDIGEKFSGVTIEQHNRLYAFERQFGLLGQGLVNPTQALEKSAINHIDVSVDASPSPSLATCKFASKFETCNTSVILIPFI